MLNKLIIYVRIYHDCFTIHLSIRNKLEKEIMDTLDAPDISCFLMDILFTRVNTELKKEEIISHFKGVNSTLRIIIATSTFGMGFPDIRQFSTGISI